METKKPKKKTAKPTPAVKPDGDPGLSESSEPEAPKLTDKQRMFVEQYLQCWNATEAAKRAGYSPDTAYSIGQRLLKEVEISALIKARLNEAAMSADEVLRRLADVARGNIGAFMDDEGYFDLTDEEAINKRYLLKRSKIKKRVGGPEDDQWTETETELELHDPVRALELIGKHHKLFTDKVEHSGPNEGPIKHEDVGAYRGMDRNELNRGIEQALKTSTGS